MPEMKGVSRCAKVFTLMSSMLLLAPCSVGWYWGAVSVYGISFAIYRLNAGQEVQSMWMIPFYYAFRTLVTIANGFVSRFVDRRRIILVGSLMVCTAMFSSYFLIHKSWIGLELMISLMVGFGDGLIYGNVVYFVVETSQKDVGLLTAILQSSYSIGGLVITQLVTWYVNPSNETPNVQHGSTKYFSQPGVVDKVPSAFLILGGLTLGVHISAFVIFFVNQQVSRRRESFNTDGEGFVIVTRDTKVKKYSREDNTQEKQSSHSCDHKDDAKEPSDFSPREMLKTKTFYALWVSAFFSDFSFIVLLNYYKLYGQLWIRDDHFLSSLGSSFTFIALFSRIAWGMGLDRFGPRNVALILLTTTTLTVSWYYFTPMLGRWSYFVVTLIYASSAGTLFSFYLGVTALIFGRRNIDTNYGILTSSSVAFNALAPFIIDALMFNLGWFATFAVAGGVNIISLISCLTFIPHRHR